MPLRPTAATSAAAHRLCWRRLRYGLRSCHLVRISAPFAFPIDARLPSRTSRRQLNSKCLDIPYRRATPATVTSHRKVSRTRRSFSSQLHRRRLLMSASPSGGASGAAPNTTSHGSRRQGFAVATQLPLRVIRVVVGPFAGRLLTPQLRRESRHSGRAASGQVPTFPPTGSLPRHSLRDRLLAVVNHKLGYDRA
jgi:hypothetical protein